jgi:hypothetical protein
LIYFIFFSYFYFSIFFSTTYLYFSTLYSSSSSSPILYFTTSVPLPAFTILLACYESLSTPSSCYWTNPPGLSRIGTSTTITGYFAPSLK